MAFSNGFRYETEWFQAHEGVRQKRARGMHSLMGPNNMSGFDRHQMCMDVISWILEGDSKKREYDEALHWLADFLKYLSGFTTQEEEGWFDTECNRFYVDLTGNRRNSNFLGCSKALSGVLRHCGNAYLFSPSGSMNISDVLDQLEGNNPKQYGLSGAQFAALLLCNNKQRFFVEIFILWTWYPFSAAATYPFDVRLGCLQGHSNQASDRFTVHHSLTYDEAMCLGWIFHVTDWKNTTSINRSGLKTDAKGTGKGARDATHFMYQNDNGQGYLRMAKVQLHHVITITQRITCWFQSSLRASSCSLPRMGLFYFSVILFRLNICISKNNDQHWHALSLDLEEDICCHLQSLVELGQRMLAMVMFDVRRVLAL